MSFSPSITVVIPTYNRSRETIAAVESVLAQTYPPREIIVVDDGSTDGSGEAVGRFIAEAANRAGQGAKLLHLGQANQGPSVARNRGIEQAQGEYIAFLDSDDLWVPEKLEWQMRALVQFHDECGGCFTDARMVNNQGLNTTSFRSFGKHYEQARGIASDALPSMAKGFCGFWLSTLLVRTDLARKIGGFDGRIQAGEDRDFYFRLALTTSLAYVNAPLVQTDRSPSPAGSDCRPWDRWQVVLRSRQLMYEKWLGPDSRLPAEVRKVVESGLRATHSHWTNWYLAHEKYPEARQAVSRAMGYGFNANLAAKWMMTYFVPSLAHKVMLSRGGDNAAYNR